MTEPRKDQDSHQETEGAVPFDDCLRILVNTPPKPKRVEDKPPSEDLAKKSKKQAPSG